MIAIVFATTKEAAPFLSRTEARAISTDLAVEDLYEFCDGTSADTALVVVTGMGRQRAADAIAAVLDAFDIRLVINAGLCGALTKSLSTGDIRTVTTVRDGDDAGESQDLNPWTGLEPARLVTVTEPVHGGTRRDELATMADIVDMEGWEIARHCAARNVPCTLIKGVSDQACESASSDIAMNIATVSERLTNVLLAGLPQIRLRGGFFSRLHRFTRVEHTIFSLPLIFAGAWIGAGHAFFGCRTAALIVVVGLGGRTMGMALNRLFDRNLDALNPRTASRELPSGALSVAAGYGVAFAGLVIYLAGCAGLGRLCLILSPVPLIPLAAYSLLKRFTSLCHFGIGICLALAPLGAYVAAADSLPLHREILLLAAFTFFWISGFDIIYALQDMDSDKNTGVKSIPASLGWVGAQLVAACSHAAAWGVLAALWYVQGYGILSGVSLAVALCAFCAAYVPAVPLAARFFPLSAVAGIAGALVPLLKGTS